MSTVVRPHTARLRTMAIVATLVASLFVFMGSATRADAVEGFTADVIDDAPGELAAVEGSVPVLDGNARVGETLAAAPGSWTEGAELSFQWSADGSDIDGAIESTYTVAAEDLGKPIAVSVTGTLAGHHPTTIESAPTGAVTAGELTSTKPIVSGTPAYRQTLTAVPGDWTAGATLSYQWSANGVAIPGAQSSMLKIGSAQRGTQISVTIIGNLAGYNPEVATSAKTPKVATVATPTITGKAAVGSTLTAVPGTWTTGTTWRYQWFADGEPVAGATASKFAPKSPHEGAAISVAVTGAKSGYATVTRTSVPTSRVMLTAVPKISGVLAYGSTLTAVPGTWTAEATLTLQWYADGKTIAGATSSTLKLSSALKGKRISVAVTGRKAGYTSVKVLSASSARVATAATPKISGVASTGTKVTAVPGAWTSGSSFRYQWYADGSKISGATASTLTVPAALAGKRLTVAVTGLKSGYASVSRTSAATLRVMRATKPSISGSAVVTKTLAAAKGTWTSGAAISYQWFADGRAISGATGSTLRLSAGLAGKRITVRVVGKLSGYPTTIRTSSATAAVSYPNRTTPTSVTSCPSWAPIKGNRTTGREWIYHVQGGQYYAATHPEECFRTESAAQAAGYRKSKR